MEMKLVYILLISLSLLISCSKNENLVGGGNTHYPRLYLNSNIDYPNDYIYENDTVKIKHLFMDEPFFELTSMLKNDIIIIQGVKTGIVDVNLRDKVRIWFNPLDSSELFIKGLEPNYNSTGWYSLNEYHTYRIYIKYKEIDTILTNKSYLFDIRNSKEP